MKLFKKLNNKNSKYLQYRKEEIDTNAILLEAGQGKNVNGNMFALLREINVNPKWKDFHAIFVVTEDTMEAAKTRLSFYNYKAKLVIRNSQEYMKYLATCKYVATDNSFPPYFHKRDEQIFLNTWHGTPLKTLGKSDIRNAKSLANIQKNYMMSDYALFPNAFTRDVFMYDYMIENLFAGKVLLCDYPRNSAFLRVDDAQALRKKLHLEDMQLIAYMPTWRGGNREADGEVQKEILHKYFTQIDRMLKDDQIFYVNLHFLVGNAMDFTSYTHIRPFPKEYETYDFLAICDMLVTDYSSVFFDFAVTGKKISLFAYDLEEYMRTRGTYFPIEDLPFVINEDVEGLIKDINEPISYDQEKFLSTYCAYRSVDNPEKIMDLMVNGNTSDLVIEDGANNHKDNVLFYGGKLKSTIFQQQLKKDIVEYADAHPEENVILCFRGAITPKVAEYLISLPENINYLALVNKFEFSNMNRIKATLAMRNTFFANCFESSLQEAYAYEWQRLCYHIRVKKIVYDSAISDYMYKIITKTKATLIAYLQHPNVVGMKGATKKASLMQAFMKKHYDQVLSHQKDDVHPFFEECKETYYNLCFKAANLWMRQKVTGNGVTLSGTCMVAHNVEMPIEKLAFMMNEQVFDAHCCIRMKFSKKYQLVHWSLSLSHEEIESLSIQNKISFYYMDQDGYGLLKGMRYSIFNRRRGKNKHGKLCIIPEVNTTAYVRQTVNNILYFTVRRTNVSDARSERVKLFFAYYLAKVLPLGKKILLFEKESSRYEESASVLYEHLLDRGYQNAYFIIDKNYAHFDEIPEKYRGNLVYKNTFKHYLYFFKSKTFLGSEALVHAIDLRIINRYALRKLAAKDIDYVFLQHGVMYMVSLDSESRTFFKPKVTKGKYRVVVSSQEEARHFIELGKYNPEFIYISGLPKYDRNMLKDDADRIVIMPTWRPWEYNEARYDFTQTNYYKMIKRIFDAIPSEYHEKITILPHPLFFDAVKDSEFDLKPYLDADTKYDDILKETKVLITDYSSIAYDAFYRGANVMFYWEEKDECLEHYGPSTKLMLNKDNVYGDICNEASDVTKVFERNYLQKQNPVYVERYKKLVQFHDGQNTERLISFLEKDDII